MNNLLRIRNSLSNDDSNTRLKKSYHCSNGLSINCQQIDNETQQHQQEEDSCDSPLNAKSNNYEFQNNTKQRPSLLNTLKFSPHLNSVLPQLQATPEKKSYGEMFYKNEEIQKRPRLVKKCGELNIQMENVAKHKRRLFKDFFNTIIGYIQI
jgi:ribosomal protein L33